MGPPGGESDRANLNGNPAADSKQLSLCGSLIIGQSEIKTFFTQVGGRPNQNSSVRHRLVRPGQKS